MKIIVSTMKGILSTNIDFISMAKRNLQNCIPSESKHEHFKLHQQDLRFMIWTIWIWYYKNVLKYNYQNSFWYAEVLIYPNFWFIRILQTGLFLTNRVCNNTFIFSKTPWGLKCLENCFPGILLSWNRTNGILLPWFYWGKLHTLMSWRVFIWANEKQNSWLVEFSIWNT